MGVVKVMVGTNNVITPVATAIERRKMLISAIKKSEKSIGEKIVLYGPEGWGKDTWAKYAEKPIYLSTEDGLKSVPGVDAFPEATKWEDIVEAIETLRLDKHDFKTLVISTADWAEQLSHTYICTRDNKQSIEDYGWGGGYNLAFDEWKKLIHSIDVLKTEKGLNIIFLAHSTVKTFKNPMGEDYDRYELKTHKYVSSLLKEWSDCVLFGNYDVNLDVKKNRKGETIGKAKAYGDDRRILHCTHNAAWDAKNRYGINEPLNCPLESPAQEFWKIVNSK